jgi:Helix-turn-helix of DDE superfamily endonuclease
LLNYDRLSKKPLLFRSFTGLELSEFDSIYKEIESKYPKYEIKRLSRQKERTRSIGAGRHFKHAVKDRFLMLLVYYKLYITNLLSGFLFDLDQSNVHRERYTIYGTYSIKLYSATSIYTILQDD